jgi:Kef-type K+ transport system membrane component KefB
MRRVLALAIALLVAYLIVSKGGAPAPEIRSTGLAFGFALIAAAVVGDLIGRLSVPKVTGYLLFGLVCGPSVLNIITRPMARELALFNGLTVALIAFTAGLEINVARMRPRLPSMMRLGMLTIGIVWTAFVVVFWLAWPWLGIDPGLTGLSRLAVVMLLATLITSFSPTVTLAVIAESRATGPMTELTLAIVILADLVLVLLFTLSMQFVQWATTGALEGGVVANLAWKVFGSFAFGGVLGSLFALYLTFSGRQLTVVLIGLCALLSGLGDWLHFEPVLAALAAGVVVENQVAVKGDALKDALERGALPVLVVFFVAAGASLYLDALAELGAIALAIAGLRAGLVWASLRTGARLWPETSASAGLAWTGLVSQAGVTLGLTMIVATDYPSWGATVKTLVVANVALNTLVGPVIFRNGLARAGEIDTADLALQPQPAADPR